MGYLGENTPKLGFGLMRLPKLENDEIDIEQVKQMVDLFMERGFTYFDTARAYNGSEAAIKEALVDRYPRDSYTLATKNAAWIGASNAEEAQAYLATSLETAGVEYFDYYLLHNLGSTRTKFFDDFGMWEWAVQQREAGLIKHLGVSIHDKADFVDRILTEHPEIEFVQLQINWADWEDPVVQARQCYETCLRHNKPVIIMEPVKGGTLANVPERVAEVLAKADPAQSPAQWAIRFAASLPGVITVLSGMSSLEQAKENTTFMQNFQPLSDSEQAVVAEAREKLAEVDLIPCTACEYCTKGCPQEIAIPRVLGALNRLKLYDEFDRAKGDYNFATRDHKASECIECMQCEAACPQSINITELLKEAVGLFEDPAEETEEAAAE